MMCADSARFSAGVFTARKRFASFILVDHGTYWVVVSRFVDPFDQFAVSSSRSMDTLSELFLESIKEVRQNAWLAAHEVLSFRSNDMVDTASKTETANVIFLPL